MQSYFDYNKPNTDQCIQYCLENAPANVSFSRDPKPQLTHATDGKPSGSTLPERDVAENGSGQLHKEHKCLNCGKVFKNLANLNRHQGETPYECQYCRERFTGFNSLKNHLRIHSGKSLHGCATCGKIFYYPSLLKSHLRIHTGETPFECRHCGKKFKQLSNLRSHNRSRKHLYNVKYANQPYPAPAGSVVAIVLAADI